MRDAKASFISFTNGSNWVAGKVGIYLFEAKLFDEPSNFGIDNGRVSKLAIYDDQLRKAIGYFNSCIVNYDRGWDIKPKDENLPFYRSVMQLLENSPKRFV